MILFLFEPIKMKNQQFDEIPLLKLEKFKINELNTQGLSSILEGSIGLKYEDRYLIDTINYTDNENKYLANIKSNSGLYKGNLLELNGDVVYSRADGFSFKSQKVEYNEKTKIVKSPTNYVSFKGKHKVVGSSIVYNSITEITKSKNVIINYKLKER